jgi:hypothetical protein
MRKFESLSGLAQMFHCGIPFIENTIALLRIEPEIVLDGVPYYGDVGILELMAALKAAGWRSPADTADPDKAPMIRFPSSRVKFETPAPGDEVYQ